jgi:hypothetical protein
MQNPSATETPPFCRRKNKFFALDKLTKSDEWQAPVRLRTPGFDFEHAKHV